MDYLRNSHFFLRNERTTSAWPLHRASDVAFGKIVLVVFILCQASDGLLTYFAVSTLGHVVEGNPILATWMTLAGPGPTLVVAKLAACGCGLVLYTHGSHRALAALTAIYLLAAVGPWLYVLSS